MKNKLQSYEKKFLLMLSLGIILILSSLSFVVYSITTNYLANFTIITINSIISALGIFALIFFVTAFSLFISKLLIKFLTPKGILSLNKLRFNMTEKKANEILEKKWLITMKKILIVIYKILQNLHVVLAMTGISIIIVHLYLGFYIGFQLTVHYILAIFALIAVILTCIFGIIKIFNKNFFIHRYVAIIFIILFLLHALF